MSVIFVQDFKRVKKKVTSLAMASVAPSRGGATEGAKAETESEREQVRRRGVGAKSSHAKNSFRIGSLVYSSMVSINEKYRKTKNCCTPAWRESSSKFCRH